MFVIREQTIVIYQIQHVAMRDVTAVSPVCPVSIERQAHEVTLNFVFGGWNLLVFPI